MTSPILLGIGIGVVIIGVVFLFRESKGLSRTDADEMLRAMNRLESKLNSSLRVIEELSDALLKLETKAETKDSAQPLSLAKGESEYTSKLKSKHIKVLELYNQGLNSKEIAIRLNKGVGEIETIISLLNLERK